MTLANYTFPGYTPTLTSGQRRIVLFGIVTVEVLALCLPGNWWGIAGVSLLALGILFALLLSVVRGRGEVPVLSWVLIFPLGYYFLSFAREHPLFTLDRLLIAVLLLAACFAEQARVAPIPALMRKSAVWWGVFLLFAAIATLRTNPQLSSLRLWIEPFLFPALLSWYVLRYLEVRKYLSWLHIFTCIMTLYVAAIGVGEVLTQQDLLPLPDGDIYVAGDTRGQLPKEGGLTDFLVRPNGPFSTNNTFAMDGLVSLFFLFFLKQALKEQMPAWQRVLHRIGVGAALAQALMPLFRSVLLSLFVVLIVDMLYQKGWRRTIRMAAILSLGSVFLLLRIAIPEAFEDRTDPENLYGRIAQQQQTFAIFLDHPINGVGLNNFHDVAGTDKYTRGYKGVESVDYPHNNLGAVLVETGLAGFVPFVCSQVLFFTAFWRLRRESSPNARLAWKAFLFIFICYWINGMSLTIAYFSDLNLWYMLVLSVLYKYGVTVPARDAGEFVCR
jgi:hypothetical protein